MLSKELLIKYIRYLRRELARQQAPILLGMLGLISGSLAGGVILLFRLLIESSQFWVLSGPDFEDYESLDFIWQFFLPVVGAGLIALVWQFSNRDSMTVGVVHVLERLSYHEGHLPLKNAIFQFFGAAIGIVSGFSVGREGPGIHLGSAAASLLGQRLVLPNNAVHILVACGTAAAIAASFNTPLAGVIFAMEVVVMEYTIAGFTPVIMAAVASTVLSRAVYGDDVAFFVPQLHMNTLWELPFIILLGAVIGLIAVCFMRSLTFVTRIGSKWSLWQRLLLGGLLMGCISLNFPQVMSIGYDTVNEAILGQLGLGLLLMIIVAKILATVVSIGFGVPGGLIGPTLFIGACAGAFIGELGHYQSTLASPVGFYAMLGMAAMMSATLQAPLAALLALLELTDNPNILLPGMLAVVTANLTAKELFSNGSIFLSQMRDRGLDYFSSPVVQAQRRIGVTALMQESYALTDVKLSRDQAMTLLENEPQWLLIRQDETRLLLPAVDLGNYCEVNNEDDIDLMEVPGHRLELTAIDHQATLYKASRVLEETGAEALYVSRRLGAQANEILGILRRSDIEESYRLPH